MRKIATLTAVAGILMLGTVAAFADEPPKAAQAAKPAPAPPAQSHEHKQGMEHGGQDMHDRMMKDHREGMQNMPNHSGSSGSANGPSQPAHAAPPPKASGSGCCKDKPMDKPMKPADKPMPMNHM